MIGEFVFYVLIFTIIQIIFLYCLSLKRKVQDWLEIGIIFEIIYSMYVLIGAWDRVWAANVNNDDLIMYYLLTSLGALFFNFGYLLVNLDNSNISVNKKILYMPKLTRVKKFLCAKEELFLGSLVILLCIVNRDKVLSMVINFGRGKSYTTTAIRSVRTALSGPLSLFSSYFVNMTLGFCFYKMYKSKSVRWLYTIPIIIIGVYYLTSGGRTVLFFIAMLGLVFINYFQKNLKLYQFALLGILGVLGMILLGHLRAANSISGMIHILLNNDVSRLANVRSSGEFYNTTGTFFSYINAISNGRLNYDFGMSYLTEILVFVPYFLYPGRPKPLPEQFMEIFYPQAKAGTGHGWFILNDGYMSFGIFGIAVEMFLFGVILACVYKYFVKNIANSSIKILYAYLCVYMLITVRGSVLSSLKVFVLEMFPFIIAFIISKYCKNRSIK